MEKHKKKGYRFVNYEKTDTSYQEKDFLIPEIKSTIFIKRFFDILLSFTAILFFLPIGSLFALMILLEDRGPIFYAQRRVGKGGKIFYIYKFRSMIEDAMRFGELGGMRGTDWRITRMGAIMRNMALDELPQLFNILRGDMSFVGPRPEVPRGYMELTPQIPGFKNRLQVTAGLVCVAALCNMDTPDWITEMRREIHYDMFYIRKYSFWFDLILIIAGLKTTLFLDWGTKNRKL